jgi:hypothetical protein
MDPALKVMLLQMQYIPCSLCSCVRCGLLAALAQSLQEQEGQATCYRDVCKSLHSLAVQLSTYGPTYTA